MNVVSIKGRASDSEARRFCGSGFLVGPCHVLTALHVWQEATRFGPEVWVGMLPDCEEPLAIEAVAPNPGGLDACVMRVGSWEAPEHVVFPALLEAYLPLTRQPVELRAVTPVMPRVTPVPLTVTAFDQATYEYEVAETVASGNSGGAVVHENVVIGLMTRRVENQPIARFLSLHVLAEWIRAVVDGRAVALAPDASLEPIRIPPSPEGRTGLSHRLGSIHLHVDGAQARTFIEGLVARHQEAGFDAELAWVVRATQGPQREEHLLRDFYQLHDPGELDFFSTTHFHSGDALPTQAQRRLLALEAHDILCDLHGQGEAAAGAVVELERVVGTVDAEGTALMAADLEMRGTNGSLETQPAMQLFIAFNKVDQKLAKYELHFSIDIRKTPDAPPRPPVALEDLRVIAQAAGVEQGGWFLFHDEHRWAYRSNAFVPSVSSMALRLRWQRLRRQLDDSPIAALRDAKLRLVAEEALAVWRAPLILRSGYRPVRELIAWEGNMPALREFWVLLPNFLGDQSDEMGQAMERNLVRGVRYTYFLSSHADAKRWLNFRDELTARGIRGAQRLMTAYVVAFSPDGPLANFAAFIANPQRETAEGYELTIDDSTNRVLYGMAMERARIEEVTQALSSSTGTDALTDWHLVQPTGPDMTVTAVCVKLIESPEEDEIDALIDGLDNHLAVLASHHRGSVAVYGTRSITAVFVGNRPELGLALGFARKVLEAADHGDIEGLRAPLRIGMAHGRARLTARASGRVWNGPALRACHHVLGQVAPRSGIFVAATDQGTLPIFDASVATLRPLADGIFELVRPNDPAPSAAAPMAAAADLALRAEAGEDDTIIESLGAGRRRASADAGAGALQDE
ncbi:MAG: hypothetical protein JF586_05235 [Burkholderiales bacterium]|nr:hypothetical protein [Burkholderiales bacterium]